MKKGLAALLVVVLCTALTLPAAVLAKGPDKGGDGRPGKQAKADREAKPAKGNARTEKPAATGSEESVAERKAAAQERKAERLAAKEERKAEHEAAKAARTPDESVDSAEFEDGDVDASNPETTVPEVSDPQDGDGNDENADTSRPKGVENAFARITANLEKSLARVADGKGKQVPPGLVRVWLKFASWLGADPSTMPGSDVGTVEPPTSATEPTSTVEPTMTVEPSATVDPSGTVDSTSSPAP